MQSLKIMQSIAWILRRKYHKKYNIFKVLYNIHSFLMQKYCMFMVICDVCYL
jgi:hypothetical protein